MTKSYSLRHPINYLYYHSNNILPIDEILDEPDNYLNLNTIKSIICLPLKCKKHSFQKY